MGEESSEAQPADWRRRSRRMLVRVGLPVAAVAAAAVTVVLLMAPAPAPVPAPVPAPARTVTPHLAVFKPPPDIVGSAPGGASGRATLLAVARAAARAPEQPAGRYWLTPGLAGNFVEVGSSTLHYVVLEKVITQNWAARSASEGSPSMAEPLGVELATAGDQTAWQHAGSPVRWTTISQNDGLTDPQGNAHSGRLAPVSAVQEKPQVTPGNVGDPPFPVGNELLSLAGLRALPADPATLKAILMQVWNGEYGDAQAYLFQAVPLVLDMPVTPAVRSALYRVLAGLPGVHSLGAVRDVAGRRGVAVGYSASYPACGGVLNLGGSGAAGFHTTFPSCTVQQILVMNPVTGRPMAEELRYAKLPGGARWPVPDQLFSYEIYGTAHWTNANPPS